MQWYVLLAHPNQASYNHAVCRSFVKGLSESGSVAQVNDLYATGFNPVMAGNDFNQFMDGGELPEDVKAEQAKVDKAEGLALIYPVWWNEAPAILKGWIDRVLSKGWAYDVTSEGVFVPMLKLKKIIIFNTADNPEELLEGRGLNKASRITKKKGTFGFCGVKNVEHYITGNIGSDESARLKFLKMAEQIGRTGSYTGGEDNDTNS